MYRFTMGAGGVLTRLGRLAGAVILAGSVTATAAYAASYVPKKAIALPGGITVTSFDIGYVNTTLGMYYLASRDVKGVVAVNTTTNAVVFSSGGFAGVKTSATSGPNGLITVNHSQVWAGDGDGTIKVLNARTGALIKTIGPKIGTLTATDRADEACWDPQHNVVLWAWDEPADTFVAFISTVTYKVLKTFKMDGLAGDGPTRHRRHRAMPVGCAHEPDLSEYSGGQWLRQQYGEWRRRRLNGATQSIVKTYSIPCCSVHRQPRHGHGSAQ